VSTAIWFSAALSQQHKEANSSEEDDVATFFEGILEKVFRNRTVLRLPIGQ